MCGISGIIQTNGVPVVSEVLIRFNNALAHRGPDGAGLHLDGAVGLGHRRLAILDPKGGAQPFCNKNRTVCVTFNGEIYNYRELRHELTCRGHCFTSRSDTEVIVHSYEEWGKNCLQHLRGMFAFGIWDARVQELFLARDRIGIKPLCYFSVRGIFAFASEIQAFRYLDLFSPSLDFQALDIYLHFQYIPAPYSIYREVKKLPPAHYMVVGKQGILQKPTRYWDIEFRPDRTLNEAKWVERLDAALQESVKSHLVSDVPFGAFLSGGVDSSTIVGYMSQLLDTPIKTFTIGFHNKEYDERRYAIEAAKLLGTEHHEEVVDSNGLDVLPTLVNHYGEPFGDSSAICAYHVSRIARDQVKMVLSGDGGDEIFAGYSYYPKMIKNYPEPQGGLEKSRRVLGNLLRRVGLKTALPSYREGWYRRSPYFDETRRRNLWHQEYHALLPNTRAWSDTQFDSVSRFDLLSQCQYVDIHNYLPYDNLTKMDIASMAHGLEVRVPLLDHIFLDTVSQIPPEIKIKQSAGGDPLTKYIFKKTSEHFFTHTFLNRKKLGFSAPIPTWLAGTYCNELRERLMASEGRLDELFDRKVINNMLDEHHKTQTHGGRLWSLLFLAEWNRQNPVSFNPL